MALMFSTYNLGQNKINNMGEWRVFALRAPSSLIWGGWGFAVPFYFVQDCSYSLVQVVFEIEIYIYIYTIYIYIYIYIYWK